MQTQEMAETEKKCDNPKITEAQNLTTTGANLSKRGKYSEAYGYFDKARSLYEQEGDKANAAIQLRYMGFLKDTLGNSHNAIELYKESKRLFEETGDSKEACESAYRLAASLYRENRIDESLEEYKYAAKDEEQSSNVFNNLGFLLIQKGELKEAEKNFLKAQEIYKETEENLGLIKNNLGIINYLEGNLEKAESIFREAVECKTSKSDRTIQYILLANGEQDQNERFFRCDDVMTKAGICLNAAAVKAALKKYEEACELAGEALKLEEGMPYLTLPAAWIYLAAGNKTKAVALFKAALEYAKDKEKISKIILDINPYAFKKIDRNETCPCGSGKKFKKCHGK